MYIPSKRFKKNALFNVAGKTTVYADNKLTHTQTRARARANTRTHGVGYDGVYCQKEKVNVLLLTLVSRQGVGIYWMSPSDACMPCACEPKWRKLVNN